MIDRKRNTFTQKLSKKIHIFLKKMKYLQMVISRVLSIFKTSERNRSRKNYYSNHAKTQLNQWLYKNLNVFYHTCVCVAGIRLGRKRLPPCGTNTKKHKYPSPSIHSLLRRLGAANRLPLMEWIQSLSLHSPYVYIHMYIRINILCIRRYVLKFSISIFWMG